MKIAILSDSHNNWNALKKAIEAARDLDADVVFFAGDLVRPNGIDVLAQFGRPVHMIIGNNETKVNEIHARAKATQNVIYHGEVCDISRKGIRIFMHHYPRPAENKAREEKYDLCIHGHLHTFRDELISDTKLINPGALSDRGSSPEWAFFDTETSIVEQISV